MSKVSDIVSPIILEDIKHIVSAPYIDWSAFEGKKILITGANGMIASYMVYVLLYLNDSLFKQPVTILCLGRSKKKMQHRFGSLLEREEVKCVIQDVAEPWEGKEKVDMVVHAASQASPKYYGIDPVGTIMANVLGTRHMLEYARRCQASSFLFISSSEVYGNIEGVDRPILEQDDGFLDPMQIRSCYGEAKRAGEAICVAYHHQYGVSAKVARLFHTYGPTMHLDDGRVYADFASDIVNHRDIVLRSAGKAKRCFCYLSDAVAALFLLMLKGEASQAYNLGNPEQELTMVELANKLVALFPERELAVRIEEKKAQEGYIKSVVDRNCPDITKLEALGWKPVVTVEQGFKNTVKVLDEC